MWVLLWQGFTDIMPLISWVHLLKREIRMEPFKENLGLPWTQRFPNSSASSLPVLWTHTCLLAGSHNGVNEFLVINPHLLLILHLCRCEFIYPTLSGSVYQQKPQVRKTNQQDPQETSQQKGGAHNREKTTRSQETWALGPSSTPVMSPQWTSVCSCIKLYQKL